MASMSMAPRPVNAVRPAAGFTPRMSSATNSVAYGDVRPETKIRCHARDCVYNKDMNCSADSVQIAGPGADRSGDTQCSTFRARG